MKNDLSAFLIKELSNYSKEVDEGIKKVSEDVAKDSVKVLKATSPKRTGKYARSWKYRKTENGYVIHNSRHYMKTHLLEKGHAKIGGGRVSARVHIKPVEEDAIRKMEKGVEEYVRKIR